MARGPRHVPTRGRPFRSPVIEVYVGRERAGAATAMTLYRSCAPPSTICSARDSSAWGISATGVLVETLLDRGAEGDVAEAEAAIERLADRASRRGSGDTRDLAAAAARAAGPGPRRRCCLPGLGESLSRDGGIAWLRRTHRLGRGDDRGWGSSGIGGARMTAGVACGSCGTGLRENAKFCDECGAPTAVSGDTGGVQAGDGAVRRRGALDGHRGRAWIWSGCARS